MAHKLAFISGQFKGAVEDIHRKFDVLTFNSAQMRGTLRSRGTGEEVEFHIFTEAWRMKGCIFHEVQEIGMPASNELKRIAAVQLRPRS